MGQRERQDGPGVRHHVMCRGIGKRIVLSLRADFRYLLSQLARAYRRDQLELEAYSLLGTHFHLLVRTEGGTLSEGMRRVLNGYSRWFNRRNRRDGPLFRGRFRSKPVTSDTYLRTLLRYIDNNPVKAGLCAHPAEWPWGSARSYCGGLVPRWLAVGRVQQRLLGWSRPGLAAEAAYGEMLTRPLGTEEQELVEQRLDQRGCCEDRLDDLLARSSSGARAWMEVKARNADGLRPALALVAPTAVERAIATLRDERGELPVQVSRKSGDGWEFLMTGLQSQCCGLGGRALALRHAVSIDTASRHVRAHANLLEKDPGYSAVSDDVLRLALRLTFGS